MTQIAAGEARWARKRQRNLKWFRERRGFDGVVGSGGRCGLRRRRGGVRQEEELERWGALRTRTAFCRVLSQFAADAGSNGAFGEFAHGLDKGIERWSNRLGDDGGRAKKARGLRITEGFAEEGRSGRRVHRRVDGRRICWRKRRGDNFVGRSRWENRELQGRKGSSGSRATGHTFASLLLLSGWHCGR